MSRNPRFGGGPTSKRSVPFEWETPTCHDDSTTPMISGACSIKSPRATILQSEQQFSMQESPPTTNEKISNAKSNNSKSMRKPSNPRTPRSKSSKTSAVVSTTTAKVLQPFWNASIKDLSQRLWLPIATDLCVSDWSSWNGSAQSMIQKSWFSATLKTMKTMPMSTNCEMTYSPLQLSLWHATTVDGPHKIEDVAKKQPKSTSTSTMDSAKVAKTAKEQANACKKIRLNPTTEQLTLLKQWMGTNRWTYNQAVASKRTTKNELRSQFVNNDQFAANDAKSWVLETPYEIRDAAICDLVKGIKTSKQLLRNGKIRNFRMSFRSKKNAQESFVIRNRDYQRNGDGFTCFRGFFKKANVDAVIRAREPLPQTIQYDSRLIRTRLNEWFLCIPTQASMPYALGDENQVPQNRICSLDPGVRTFQTVFDANGAIVEFGAKDLARLYRLCRQADKIQSKRDKLHGKKRYKLRLAYLRIFRRIRNLVSEIHKKMTNFLVLNYNVILLPTFETKPMSSKSGACKLQSKTVRSMLTWSHYRFKQRLLNKSKTTAHCKVIVCGEEYTSKTCTRCGFINNALGGSKIFQCPQCSLCIDRDHNGARNILLKNASHFHFGGCGVETTLLEGPCGLSARGDQN